MKKNKINRKAIPYIIGFLACWSFFSTIAREFIVKDLQFQLSTVSAISNGIIFLTAYPLFVRHIQNQWSNNKNEPISFDVWALITLGISICTYLFFTVTD